MASRQENTVAVFRSEESTIHIILRSPRAGGVVHQFFAFLYGGHAPATAPVGRGSVVFWLQNDQFVSITVVTIVSVVTILGLGVFTAVAILVSAPIVIGLCRSFTPCEVTT